MEDNLSFECRQKIVIQKSQMNVHATLRDWWGACSHASSSSIFVSSSSSPTFFDSFITSYSSSSSILDGSKGVSLPLLESLHVHGLFLRIDPLMWPLMKYSLVPPNALDDIIPSSSSVGTLDGSTHVLSFSTSSIQWRTSNMLSFTMVDFYKFPLIVESPWGNAFFAY